jgi:hypothetical protein
MITSEQAIAGLRNELTRAIAQIEYLHLKFGETGSGNGTVAQINYALSETTPDKVIQSAERQELSDQQIGEIYRATEGSSIWPIEFARAIIAADRGQA